MDWIEYYEVDSSLLTNLSQCLLPFTFNTMRPPSRLPARIRNPTIFLTMSTLLTGGLRIMNSYLLLRVKNKSGFIKYASFMIIRSQVILVAVGK